MTKNYSTWVGGIEVNDHYLTKSEAQSVAAAYVADGYEDVAIEPVFTCEHCWNGLATENFGKWQVCPECLEFLTESKSE